MQQVLKSTLTAVMFYCFTQTASAALISVDSTDVPLAVPPSGTSGTTVSTLDVGVNGSINDLNVFLDIDHTFTGDLNISISHGATSALIFNQIGGSNDNIPNVTFDDESSNLLAAPFNLGDYMPETALSVFDGMDIFGTWTLTVDDVLSSDVGTLNAWGIRADVGPASEVPAPGALALLAVGLLGLGWSRRKPRA